MNEAEIIDWSLLQEAPDRTLEEAVSWAFLEAQSARVAAEKLELELKLLAEEKARPWDERHPFARLQRDEWTLGLIFSYERCYSASRNPAFVFLARQAKTWLTENLSPAAYAERLKWVDNYFDDVSRRMADLVAAPPAERDREVAKALGLAPAKRGGSSEFNAAKQSMSDIFIGIFVEARLPFFNGKEQETFKEVGSRLNPKRSGVSVDRAYKRYQKLVRGR
jgi:alkanesulfonate monooxygenase SsuD/methylene tetrahydromethanopterin reductase-like flavin-dependent oxidoreductase (luciferase family)